MIRAVFISIFAMIALSAVILANASTFRFVAPGLWKIVTTTHGPMNQITTDIHEECWTQDGQPSHGTNVIPGPKSGPITLTHSITDRANRSTVHLISHVKMPNGVLIQNITMIFTRQPKINRSTMTGKGYVNDAASPFLDMSFTQHGRWIAASCPAVLPGAKIIAESSGMLTGR